MLINTYANNNKRKATVKENRIGSTENVQTIRVNEKSGTRKLIDVAIRKKQFIKDWLRKENNELKGSKTQRRRNEKQKRRTLVES